MPKFTVGSVPYVNAIPLTHALPKLGVEVVHAVPSQLPPLLDSGEAQAILVSSVDALRVPGRRMAEGVCIGSDGPVKSVRLFSRVPPSQIQTLAWDASSMTSNRLAQVVLHDAYGVRPEAVTLKPDLQGMLAQADACVLIGDLGMTADGHGLHVLDLGEEWKRLTRLPFVWAAWIGEGGLDAELSLMLRAASVASLVGRPPSRGTTGDRLARFLSPRWYREMDLASDEAAGPRRERLIAEVANRAGWSVDTVREYYLDVMIYEMDERMLAGYREFQRRLLANGFEDCRHFPDLVAPSSEPLDPEV